MHIFIKIANGNKLWPGIRRPFQLPKEGAVTFIHKRPCITTFQQRLEEKIANVNDQHVYLHNERY